MRRTGHFYYLTLTSALLVTGSTLFIVFWNDNTAAWHLWLDIVPQGFGIASLVTSLLTVSCL
jgi:hypothetical protein